MAAPEPTILVLGLVPYQEDLVAPGFGRRRGRRRPLHLVVFFYESVAADEKAADGALPGHAAHGRSRTVQSKNPPRLRPIGCKHI